MFCFFYNFISTASDSILLIYLIISQPLAFSIIDFIHYFDKK